MRLGLACPNLALVCVGWECLRVSSDAFWAVEACGKHAVSKDKHDQSLAHLLLWFSTDDRFVSIAIVHVKHGGRRARGHGQAIAAVLAVDLVPRFASGVPPGVRRADAIRTSSSCANGRALVAGANAKFVKQVYHFAPLFCHPSMSDETQAKALAAMRADMSTIGLEASVDNARTGEVDIEAILARAHDKMASSISDLSQEVKRFETQFKTFDFNATKINADVAALAGKVAALEVRAASTDRWVTVCAAAIGLLGGVLFMSVMKK